MFISFAMLSFLLALAIVDDIGSLIVIALFYSQTLDWAALLATCGIFLLMLTLNRLGLRRAWPYFSLALLLWAAMLESGVHPTLAGVITAFAIPARPKYDPIRFADLLATLLERYRASFGTGQSVLRNEQARSTLQTMEDGVLGVVPPLQRLEYKLHTPTALLVMPLFALSNAGIPLDPDSIRLAVAEPVTWGVATGLLAGKVLGVSFSTWLALRTRLLYLPDTMQFVHVIGIGLLAGIGFTMSIFMTELAFVGYESHVVSAKIAILISSLLAGASGLLWLRMFCLRGAR